MNIGIDMMGGDFAPIEAVKGVQQYLAKTENNLFCIGEPIQLEKLFQLKYLKTNQLFYYEISAHC